MKTLVPNRNRNRMMDFVPAKTAESKFDEVNNKRATFRGATESMMPMTQTGMAKQLLALAQQREDLKASASRRVEEEKVEEVPSAAVVSPDQILLVSPTADNGGTGD